VEQGSTLDHLGKRESAEILSVDWDRIAPDEGKRLRALGIDAGAMVTIAQRGIFGGRDPLAIEVGRTIVALRRSHARAMQIAPR